MLELIDSKKSWIDVNFLTLLQVKRFLGKSRRATFVHIGAYDGALDVKFIEEMKPVDTTIYALEPSSKTFKTLKRKLSKYEHCIPIHMGIGEDSQRSLLFSRETLSQGNSLYPEFAGDDESESVKMTTMTNLFKDLNLNKVDMLRINCEGGEYRIFSRKADLSFLENVNVLFLALHGKSEIFLTDKIVSQKIEISDKLKQFNFQQVYGFKFEKGITKIPIGHINQVWVKKLIK